MQKVKLSQQTHIKYLGVCLAGAVVTVSDEQAAHIVENMKAGKYVDRSSLKKAVKSTRKNKESYE